MQESVSQPLNTDDVSAAQTVGPLILAHRSQSSQSRVPRTSRQRPVAGTSTQQQRVRCHFNAQNVNHLKLSGSWGEKACINICAQKHKPSDAQLGDVTREHCIPNALSKQANKWHPPGSCWMLCSRKSSLKL